MAQQKIDKNKVFNNQKSWADRYHHGYSLHVAFKNGKGFMFEILP